MHNDRSKCRLTGPSNLTHPLTSPTPQPLQGMGSSQTCPDLLFFFFPNNARGTAWSEVTMSRVLALHCDMSTSRPLVRRQVLHFFLIQFDPSYSPPPACESASERVSDQQESQLPLTLRALNTANTGPSFIFQNMNKQQERTPAQKH